MKTFTLKFFLKTSPTQIGKHPVYARIIYDRKKCEVSTGMKCFPHEWGETSEKFVGSLIHLNRGLASLRDKVYRVYYSLSENERPFTITDIKSGLKPKNKSSISILKFYEQYLEDKLKDGHETLNTIAKYQQTFKYLNDWLEQKQKTKLNIAYFDLSVVYEFDHYLKQTPWNNKGDRLKLTSINKHHSRLKAVLSAAFKAGFLLRNPYQDFKLSFPDAKREYLTKLEIDELNKLDLTRNEVLDKVRDIFLFSCFTGLRFSDAQDLSMASIIEVNDGFFLRINQGKTGERVEIPLLNAAKLIVDKNNGSNERLMLGKILPKLSNQKVNKYLKFLAELAGINKSLTHHVARHTCATTILLDNEVPLETVSHWLGHRSVRTTQIYARISHDNLSKESVRLNAIL
ncbi:MAG: integrase/recombinase XerD [Bacteroidia bacterium]|jgi:integrase/recombinase XerD